MVLLGPPFARLAFAPPHLAYWPEMQVKVRPEGLEHARYVLALTAPFTLVTLTLMLLRRVALREWTRTTVGIVQGIGLLTVVVCFVAQWTYVFHWPSGATSTVHYFSARSLMAATAIAAVVLAATRSMRIKSRWAAWTSRTPGREKLAWAVAILAVGLTLLPVIQTDAGIAAANKWVQYHAQFTFDETMAVVNGRSPLVDFATQYAALWPYAFAPIVSLFGGSLVVFTLLIALLTGTTMLMLYDVLRRVIHREIAALLLFLPLLATSAFRLEGASPVDRYSLVTYYGTFPLRYAAPLVLVWLMARHLDRATPRRRWPLFLVAGLATLNNLEFGLPALGATIAALLVTRQRAAWRLRDLVSEAAIGLGVAVVVVAALLLLRTGSLPDPSLLTRYASAFVGGFSMIPVHPTVGVSTIIFLTYVAAIGAAVVKALDRSPDRLITGLLLWSGIFGLGAGSYYVGHSIPEKLVHAFPIWSLASSLLTVLAVRRLAARTSGLPTPAEVACLLGLGLLVCSLAQTPLPWSQLDRLRTDAHAPLFARPPGSEFVAAHTQPHESVLILATLGHRTAEVAGVENVEPYTGPESLLTKGELLESMRALEEAGGDKIFLLPKDALASQQTMLRDTFGFVLGDEDPETHMQLWIRP